MHLLALLTARHRPVFIPLFLLFRRLGEHLTRPLGDRVPFEGAQRFEPGFGRLRARWIICR